MSDLLKIMLQSIFGVGDFQQVLLGFGYIKITVIAITLIKYVAFMFLFGRKIKRKLLALHSVTAKLHRFVEFLFVLFVLSMIEFHKKQHQQDLHQREKDQKVFEKRLFFIPFQ